MTCQRAACSSVRESVWRTKASSSAPVEWTMASPGRARSSSLREQTASLRWWAPREPPKTSSIVAPSGTPKAERPAGRLASTTLRRTGFPVTTWAAAPLSSKAERACGRAQQTRAACAAHILLARPGTEFCSWIK